MTDAAEGKTGLVSTIDDVIAPFLAGNSECRAGIEVELIVLRPGPDGRPAPLTNTENKALQKALLPLRVSEEAGTFTLEIKTGAAGPEGFAALLSGLDRDIARFRAVCAEKSYTVCDTAQPSGIVPGPEHVIDRPRARAFAAAFERHGLSAYSRNFFLNSSAQVSVSYRDADSLRRDAVRLALLSAPLATAHDNSAGILENREDPSQTGLRLREGLAAGGRGGVPDFFFAAKTGEEFVRGYLTHVFNTPLIALYDQAGRVLSPVPPGTEVSFRTLAERGDGLNTQTNFDLALGMIWPHVKLGYIRDGGGVTGVRYEARVADMGPWQKDSFPLVAAGLAFDPDFAGKTDDLLARYGFCADGAAPENLSALYRRSVDAALAYRDEYGTGRLSSFLRDFGPLAREAWRRDPALSRRLAPFLRVCESGAFPGLERRQALKKRLAFGAAPL